MSNLYTNPLGSREHTAEELYIRKREAEKAAAAAREKAQQEAAKAAAQHKK
ncbi:hypothetical protein BX616_009593 [Lobosporangium transversale]|nr:hypothetical protein BX616_009593 [Lobosporangium transversale]